MNTQRTLPHLYLNSARLYPRNPMLWYNTGAGYQSISYHEFYDILMNTAAGLLALGMKKGDRAALISEGRPEWVASELGILTAGGVNVPISVKVEEVNDLRFRLSHSGSRFAFVSTAQYAKLKEAAADLADLEQIVVIDLEGTPPAGAITLRQLQEKGAEMLGRDMECVNRVLGSLSENDPANICYTSGTTADPKGIVLTHRNYTANVEQSSTFFDVPESYCTLIILPWDHSFAHTAGIYTIIAHGASLASVQHGKTPLETLKNLHKNLKDVRPTFMLSVPALAKNFRKNIEREIEKKGPVIQTLFKNALGLAYRYNGLGHNRGSGLKLLMKPVYALADKVIFSKIRESFGGRLEFFIGGGALLDMELQRFFYAIGIPMYQGYGLTEAAPVISANNPKEHKLGSSGKPAQGMEVTIRAEDGTVLPAGQEGEIVIRGENVMAGYWKNDKATAEALRGGWLYTGDLGYLDRQGYLYVLGREKSLLIGNDGEKFSPEGIEEALSDNSLYIEQVMLYNNQNAYTVGLFVLNREQIAAYLAQHKLTVATQEGQDAVIRLVQDEISAYKAGGRHASQFPARWLPSAFAILGEGFTEQNRFLNSTLKMVRGRITAHHQDRIDFMYTPEGQDPHNHQNRTIISRMG